MIFKRRKNPAGLGDGMSIKSTKILLNHVKETNMYYYHYLWLD